jgi:cell division protein FtsB
MYDKLRAARSTSSLPPFSTVRPRSTHSRTSWRRRDRRSSRSALVPLLFLLTLNQAEPGADSEHAAAQAQEQQRRTATLQARVQELEPQVQELLDTRPKLAALEAARESLHASLKQLEEDQSSKRPSHT